MKTSNLRNIASWLIPVPLLIELFFYAFTPFKHWSFIGIPKAAQPFRDLYVLTLNYSCNIPVQSFKELGSCSDSFYGIPQGGFDYPLPLFSFIRLLPIWNHQAVGFLEGFIFIVLVSVVCNRFACNPVVTILILYGHPTRYLIERGQVDLIAWILALLSVIILFALHRSREIILYDSVVISASSILLFLSALVKAFTLPSLLILSIYFRLKHKSSEIYLIPLILTVIGIVVLFNPGSLPGHHSSAVQIMPGEIFGLLVAIPNHLRGTQLAYFLIIKISACLVTIMWFWLHNRNKPAIAIEHSAAIDAFVILASTTYLSFYILTVSANYKLVSASLLLIPIFRDFFNPTCNQSLKPSEFVDIGTSLSRQCSSLLCRGNLTVSFSNAFPILLVAAPLIFNYRPYISELQFATQYFFDFFLCPSVAGIAFYYLFDSFKFSSMSNNFQKTRVIQ